MPAFWAYGVMVVLWVPYGLLIDFCCSCTRDFLIELHQCVQGIRCMEQEGYKKYYLSVEIVTRSN